VNSAGDTVRTGDPALTPLTAALAVTTLVGLSDGEHATISSVANYLITATVPSVAAPAEPDTTVTVTG
jgi:hypothetical protein